MPALFTPPDHFRELTRAEIFPDASRPLEIDLGCGDGTFLTGMAAQHPERDFLGVERMLGRVSKTARKIERMQLPQRPHHAPRKRLHCRLAAAHGRGVAPAPALPGPVAKKGHVARRLVNQSEFLDGLVRILIDGGEFLLKTDDQPYFEDALASFAAREHQFTRLDWPADAFFYPTTDFEQDWLNMGRTIHRARWRKIER